MSTNHDLEQDPLVDALLESADEALLLVTADGRIVRCNALALEYSHRSDEGANLADALSLSTAGGPVDVGALVRRALEAGRELSFGADLVARLPQADETAVELSIRPLLATPPQPPAPALLVRLRRNEERRRLMHEVRRIQHAENIMRAASGITMELAGSATALQGHLELMTHLLPAAGSALAELSAVREAAQRMRKLALQLGNFAGVPAGDVGEEGTSVEEALHESSSLALNGTAIRVSYVVEPDLRRVAIPREDLIQVLYNVLVNAVDALDESGAIHIEATRHADGQSVMIQVRDEGNGMDPRIVARVTDPYFTTKPYAAGMGLTVAVSILERYGAALQVETDPGFGTLVRINLPAAGIQTGALPATAGAEDLPDACAGAAVLLVEDDPLVRRSMQRTLESAGCTVVAVESGDRAISVFRERGDAETPFRLVITDLMMPGRNNGVQLVRRLREYDPDLPAVLSSGALHTESPDTYHAAGFQYILRKPFGDREVRSALRRVLASRAE